jgi:large subunit ribosomal protein L10
LPNAQTIVVAEYAAFEVGNLTVLRAKARESGVYLRVLKNTLVDAPWRHAVRAGLADR